MVSQASQVPLRSPTGGALRFSEALLVGLCPCGAPKDGAELELEVGEGGGNPGEGGGMGVPIGVFCAVESTDGSYSGSLTASCIYGVFSIHARRARP